MALSSIAGLRVWGPPPCDESIRGDASLTDLQLSLWQKWKRGTLFGPMTTFCFLLPSSCCLIKQPLSGGCSVSVFGSTGPIALMLVVVFNGMASCFLDNARCVAQVADATTSLSGLALIVVFTCTTRVTPRRTIARRCKQLRIGLIGNGFEAMFSPKLGMAPIIVVSFRLCRKIKRMRCSKCSCGFTAMTLPTDAPLLLHRPKKTASLLGRL